MRHVAPETPATRGAWTALGVGAVGLAAAMVLGATTDEVPGGTPGGVLAVLAVIALPAVAAVMAVRAAHAGHPSGTALLGLAGLEMLLTLLGLPVLAGSLPVLLLAFGLWALAVGGLVVLLARPTDGTHRAA